MLAMAHAPVSPRGSPFPLSSSRGVRQLPVPAPLCTALPPISNPGSFQARQPSLSSENFYTHAHPLGTGDSYFPPSHSNPCSIPSSAASTPAPTAEAQRAQSPPARTMRSKDKRASISSLLSTPDNSSGNESSASSPTCWSDRSSPTNTAVMASGNGSASTVQVAYFGQPDYDLERRDSLYDQDEDSKLYTISGSARKKSRSSPRASAPVANDSANRDEYDVLGRKKPKTPRTPMSWDPKDDILLKQLKEEQRLGWKEIATHFRGRTSHACQFRWRRLASGQLKYYQGHRRPPPVTTTAASFANEMASTATSANSSTSPRVLMTGLTPSPSSSHSMPQYSPVGAESPLRPLPVHPAFYQPTPQPTPWGNANIHAMQAYQPTPAPSPVSRAPRFLTETNAWSEQEDGLLLNRKLSFDEVNVLLAGRSEQEIWERMVKLRQNEMIHQRQPSCQTEARIPGIESVRYGATR